MTGPDSFSEEEAVATSVIQRLRQNAVNLMVKDQDVKQLADIVAELCLVCEEQQKRIFELTEELEKARGTALHSDDD